VVVYLVLIIIQVTCPPSDITYSAGMMAMVAKGLSDKESRRSRIICAVFGSRR